MPTSTPRCWSRSGSMTGGAGGGWRCASRSSTTSCAPHAPASMKPRCAPGSSTSWANRRACRNSIALSEEQDAATGKPRYQVALEPNEAAWARRRRYQGFVLLVAHRDLPESAAELAGLYRAKDVIERDFRTIKSVVDLRPVYHYTDPKVRAHVTLCVLSLLLERTLEAKLEAAGRKMSASACLARLATCHLNRYESAGELARVYDVTTPTTEQKDILAALGLGRLVVDAEVAERVEPRPL